MLLHTTMFIQLSIVRFQLFALAIALGLAQLGGSSLHAQDAPPDYMLIPAVQETPPPAAPEEVQPAEAVPSADKAPPETLIIKDKPEYQPWYYYKAWNGSIDLGVNGSEGNSQNFNLRTGLNAKRTLPWSLTTLLFNYVNNSANSAQTTDRAFFDGRYEWVFLESPWSSYAHETTDYDTFRAFNVRITLDGGVGYQFWKNDLSSFKGRFGPGVSREIGGPNNDWTPEFVFGLIYNWQISKMQKLNFSIDYFPQADDIANYRFNSQINWEVVLDQVNNLSMKIGVVDRYDSTPEGKVPNDVDYKTVLVWSF